MRGFFVRNKNQNLKNKISIFAHLKFNIQC